MGEGVCVRRILYSFEFFMIVPLKHLQPGTRTIISFSGLKWNVLSSGQSGAVIIIDVASTRLACAMNNMFSG